MKSAFTTRVEIICKVCGKSRWVKKGVSEKENPQYCSIKCRSIGIKSDGTLKTGKTQNCLNCGSPFYVQKHKAFQNRGKFCSNACKYEWESKTCSGASSFAWKGGVRTDKDGYVFININGSYVKRATIVCESINGTKLKSGDVVHHINGVKDDDRPENLTAMTRLEHNRLHGKLIKGKRGKKVKSVCLTCGSTIIAAPSANRKYCNHSCAAKHLKPRLGTGKPK